MDKFELLWIKSWPNEYNEISYKEYGKTYTWGFLGSIENLWELLK